MSARRPRMLTVTEKAKGRIARQLGRPSGSRPVALRLVLHQDSFEMIPDQIRGADLRVEYQGRTVLVLDPEVEEPLSGRILHADPVDAQRLQLVALHDDPGQERPIVMKQTLPPRSRIRTDVRSAGPAHRRSRPAPDA